MKSRSALLSRWVHHHSGNLIMHMLSGKEGPKMNNVSITMCMVCATVMCSANPSMAGLNDPVV